MRILTRYILREMVGPTLLGFAFYTFIILMRQLFELAEMIIKRSLGFGAVVKLLGLSIPHIIVLTIPMSLLFGILIAVGRLSSDSEIIAMRAAGISTSTIYRPVLYFSFVLFLVNLYLMNAVLPRGNSALQRLKADLFASSVEKEIKPRVFYDEYENLVIYINDVDQKTGEWNGVFISNSTDPERQSIIVADTGRIATVGPNRQLWLELKNSETHFASPKKPERYDLTRNAEQRFLLIDRFAEEKKAIQYRKSLRELTVFELLKEAPEARRRDPVDYRLTLVEIHKKFSIPFACLAFGIIALPLGITNRRGGKSSGFSLSILIILVYYILINNGEDLARSGKLPAWLAMWAPNAILIGFGIYLLVRANSDRSRHPLPSLLSRLGTWLAHFRSQRKRRNAVVEEETGVLSRLDIAFPNTLDRYILREFLKILAFVLLSTAILFLIVDYTEIVEEVTAHKISYDIVASYYRYFVLQVLDWTLPVSVLLATLITFGGLAKNNEITAIKANGISLYRVALPIVVIATLISALSYFLLDFVLPYSNQRVAELRDLIRGRQTPRSFTLPQRQWTFGKGRYLFNYLTYDKKNRALTETQVFEFEPDRFKLSRRVWADEARFDGTGWVFINGWVRSFGEDGNSSFTPIDTPVRLHYPERPDYFEIEAKTPNQMTFAELRRYIQTLRSSGYAADELAVDLWKKTSWPFISLVMALIALPFAFRIGKQGALYGVGIALAVGFIYWTIFGVFTKFGEVGSLPAALSAWSANILFSIAATYLFLNVET
jgi:LPS export ABC transporter permease LptF/LPS export ABC transporter permease LptG